jgi:UDPglucose 6-dehydrogenase
MKKPKIGIIGVGMVGGAMKRCFEAKGLKPFIYDKFKNFGSLEEINQADIIFVCVPTPYNKKRGFDLSFVEQALSNIDGRKIVVIKSTVWPGTVEKLQKEYPQHKILFNPEFLSEATADQDMRRPDIQIIGCTKASKSAAKQVLNILPKAPFSRIVSSAEAEMVKYFHNVHGALKVIFANQMFDLCRALDIDYKNVKECAAASKHVLTDMYLNVWLGKYRGYGGSCFPKDIRALIQFGDKIGVNLELLKTTEKINNQMMKTQGIRDPEKLGKKRNGNS